MHLSPTRVTACFVCLLFGCILLFFTAHNIDYQSIRRPFTSSYPPPRRPQTEEADSAYKLLWASRASSVKEAFIHAYSGYLKYAPFPADELRPLSNSSVQK